MTAPLASAATEHRVLASLRTAPLDDEPETDEEREAVEQARAELRDGKGVSTEQLLKDLGLAP